MVSNQNNLIVVFLLGICLSQVTSKTTQIDLVVYKGKLGQATSYNYPFKHHYEYITDTYKYRLFADQPSLDKFCLNFHRFGLSDDCKTSRFTIYVPGGGTAKQAFYYTGDGQCTNYERDSPLPDNIWKQPFCVKSVWSYLELTFYADANNQLPGFYLEYQTTIPATEINDTTPCGPGHFTCYNRECVSDRHVCTDEAACTDMSHNTYAHAFCTDYGGFPKQQSGFWANDLDKTTVTDIANNFGWFSTTSTPYPFTGPPSDHTGSGRFWYTNFNYVSKTTLKMTFHPGRLIQKENCLSFWYYMNGRDPGTLAAEWGDFQLWQRSGSYGARWLQAQVNLFCEPGQECNRQVSLSASRASNPDTRISVDDISVMPGLCPFYEADLVTGSWTTDNGCFYIRNGWLACSGSSSSTRSWLVSRGQCLVGDVKFSAYTYPRQTVIVYQYPIFGGPPVKLKIIQQSSAYEKMTFKIPMKLSVPGEIGFQLISDNDRRISLENIHTVDNACDALYIGACQTSQFYCSEGNCISQSKVCNGDKDCQNGRDEENCERICKEFQCDNGRCVEYSRVCNGVNDCYDKSDEQSCAYPSVSGAGKIIGIVIGVLVAFCAIVAISSIMIHKGCCKSRKPRVPPELYAPPAYSDCVPYAADNLGFVSHSPADHLGYVGNPPMPPPYSQELPPAYGEVSGHI